LYTSIAPSSNEISPQKHRHGYRHTAIAKGNFSNKTKHAKLLLEKDLVALFLEETKEKQHFWVGTHTSHAHTESQATLHGFLEVSFSYVLLSMFCVKKIHREQQD
jgi:hypothetical protein